MKRWPTLLCIAVCLLTAPCFAQTAPVAASGTPVPAPVKPADYPARLELAKKIDVVAPAGQQIDDAIAQLAQRVPAENRADFQQKLTASIDKKRLEEVSIESMAQTYTVPELTQMYGYMASPLAKSIADKTQIYDQLMKPEIIKMMDKAMMDAKVGANPGGSPVGMQAAPIGAPASMSQAPAAPHR